MKLSKSMFPAMIIIILLLGGRTSNAATLGFDDMNLSVMVERQLNFFGDGYAGLTWDDDWMVRDPNGIAEGVGFLAGVVSEANILYNAGSRDVEVGLAAGTFDWDGAWFTAGQTAGTIVTIQGFDGITMMYDMDIVLSTSTPLQLVVNWDGIDSLTFSSVTPSGLGWAHFVMDDFTFTLNGEAVPEPATLTLLGIGLVGLVGGAARKKLKKKAIAKT